MGVIVSTELSELKKLCWRGPQPASKHGGCTRYRASDQMIDRSPPPGRTFTRSVVPGCNTVDILDHVFNTDQHTTYASTALGIAVNYLSPERWLRRQEGGDASVIETDFGRHPNLYHSKGIPVQCS